MTSKPPSSKNSDKRIRIGRFDINFTKRIFGPPENPVYFTTLSLWNVPWAVKNRCPPTYDEESQRNNVRDWNYWPSQFLKSRSYWPRRFEKVASLGGYECAKTAFNFSSNSEFARMSIILKMSLWIPCEMKITEHWGVKT